MGVCINITTNILLIILLIFKIKIINYYKMSDKHHKRYEFYDIFIKKYKTNTLRKKHRHPNE